MTPAPDVAKNVRRTRTGLVLTLLLALILPLPALASPVGPDTVEEPSVAGQSVQSLVEPSVVEPVETPLGIWPLDPEPAVVRGFEPPPAPWAAGHRGVDLAGVVLQSVRAALPGRVSFAGRIAGRGVLVVDHGGRRTTYEPVQATVSVGDRVAAGDRLGRLELFGSHCFPRACLHWGLVAGEEYQDPLSLVGGGPVRLLPLTGGLRLVQALTSGAWMSLAVGLP